MVAACAGAAGSDPASGGDPGVELGEPLAGIDDLVAAAEAEGQVNLIALPDTWAK